MGESLSSLMHCVIRKLRTCGSENDVNSSKTDITSSTNISSSNGNGNRMTTIENGSIIDKNTIHSFDTTHNILNKSSKYLKSNTKYFNNLNQTYYCEQQQYDIYRSTSVPISICLVMLVCYIILGSLLFHRLQDWSIVESLYFCFTSLGTIGFGELTPKGNIGQYTASGYILVGMALVAMCFSLIQNELIMWLRRFGVQNQQQQLHNPQIQQRSHHTSSSLLPTIGKHGNGSVSNTLMHHNHLMHQISTASAADDYALVTVSVTPKS